MEFAGSSPSGRTPEAVGRWWYSRFESPTLTLDFEKLSAVGREVSSSFEGSGGQESWRLSLEMSSAIDWEDCLGSLDSEGGSAALRFKTSLTIGCAGSLASALRSQEFCSCDSTMGVVG